MKKLILFCSLLILAVGVNAEKVSRYINLGSPAVVPKGLSFVTVSTNVTDYRVSTDSTKYILIDASQDYPSQQDVLVNMTAISGSPSVAITLQGKKFLTDSWAEVVSVQTWTSTAIKLASTAPTRYRYYAIKMVCSTAPAWPSTVQFKQWFVGPDITAASFSDGTVTFTAGAATGLTTVAASGRITGTGGATLTGAATNINATSNFATNIGTGTTNAAVTIGNSANTIALVAPTTVTGAATLNGGLTIPTLPSSYWAASGPVALATTGTDAACTNGGRFWVSLNIPYNSTITGLSFLVGSVGGTDSVVVQLCNSAGVEVATSKRTGANHAYLVETAAQFQSCPLVTPYAAVAGRYFAVLQFNGTTAKFRAYPIPGAKFIANTAVGTWDTKADITPGTTFVADKAPFVMTY